MAYYRKNKRRFDPRYFMNERMEDEEENDGDAGETLPGEEEPEYGEEEGQDVPLEEMIPGDPGLPSAKFGGFRKDRGEKEYPGGDIGDQVWGDKAPRLGPTMAGTKKIGTKIGAARALKSLSDACSKQKEVNRMNSVFLDTELGGVTTEGCGDAEELPWVEMDGGKLTAASEDDFASILNTAEIWQRGGIEIINGRADILDALGIESPNSEALPDLMDEEPPLEE